MSLQVTATAMTACTFGLAPGQLNVLPIARTLAEGKPAANIMDHKPLLNIMPHGLCSSLANPTVAAATAAALGVLTPMPCIPMTIAPWLPGSPTVLVGNMPSLNNCSKCMCMWGGIISIGLPGAFRTMEP
ncbi:DUF4280 domain-containing protein [Sulfidibacter corallicola]|uniref:DUF4280 domain-containing protein n=1 Tax=Sulfidibacter corallicola TaxID=2818388 RepID=A0A8A4TN47_SULCO|nr:DUF4280 domain-containing protein [Sulfidibacter corallicola]QTD50970.1 DUF4280 domain-containing protein [Sulfidibacter corallicola]